MKAVKKICKGNHNIAKAKINKVPDIDFKYINENIAYEKLSMFNCGCS